jgi:hypothetical protein
VKEFQERKKGQEAQRRGKELLESQREVKIY